MALALLLSGCLEDPKVKEAVKARDPELCKEVESESGQKRCYTRVAETAGDDSICASYHSQDEKLLDECYGRVGQKTGSAATCEKATEPGTRMMCFSGAGMKANDPGICAKITDSAYEGYRDSCYSGIAVRNEDPSLCDNIRKGGYSYSECYMKVATASLDPDVCGRMEYGLQRDRCYTAVADKTGWKNVCHEIGDIKESKRCASKLEGDPSVCDGFKGRELDDCLFDSSQRGGTVEGCQKISDQTRRKYCIHNVASNSGDVEDCLTLEDNYLEDCIYRVATSANDPNSCKRLKETYRTTQCLTAVAKETASIKVCDEISQSRLKDECKKDVYDERKRRGLEAQSFTDRVGDFVGDLLETSTLSNSSSDDADNSTAKSSSVSGGGLISDYIFGGLFF